MAKAAKTKKEKTTPSKDKEFLDSGIWNSVLGKSPPPVSPVKQKLPEVDLDEKDETEDSGYSLVLQPITFILGKYWAQQTQLATQLVSKSVNSVYVRCAIAPEGTFPLHVLLEEIFPREVAQIRKDTVLLIMTQSVVVIEAFKKYVRDKTLKKEDISFIYTADDGELLKLEIDDDGYFIEPYPDDLYKITAEALRASQREQAT